MLSLFRSVIPVVAGFVVSVVLISLFELAGHLIDPLRPGLNPTRIEDLTASVEGPHRPAESDEQVEAGG